MAGPGKGLRRTSDLRRNGHADRVPGICQHRRRTAIFPNTGLPLPFISFGSSSLISIFIGMGLVLNVGLQRETRH